MGRVQKFLKILGSRRPSNELLPTSTTSKGSDTDNRAATGAEFFADVGGSDEKSIVPARQSNAQVIAAIDVEKKSFSANDAEEKIRLSHLSLLA